MGAVLSRIDDPRDNLEKANRDELEAFAQERGVTEITEGMPAILMRKLLRAKGIVNIHIPERPLGANPGVEIVGDAPGEATTVNSDDDLERQWKQEITTTTTDVPKDIESMTIGELKKECKARGVKFLRTDKMETIRDMLRGRQNAA